MGLRERSLAKQRPAGSQSPSQKQLAQTGASSHRFHVCCALFDPLTPFPAGSDHRGNIEGAKIELLRPIRGKDVMIILGHMPFCPTRKHRQKWACAPNRRVPC